MPPRKTLGNGKREMVATDPEYNNKRAKNNDEAKETMEKVSQLKQENEMLEERIKLLSKELTFLKDIFMAHAGSAHGITVDDLEIKSLLEEDEDLMDGEEAY